MKREFIGKVMLCMACITAIVCLDLMLVGICVRNIINPTEVPVACVNLLQGHVVQADEIEMITVPSVYVLDHAYDRNEDVIGKKVAVSSIPAGSLFYRTQLK